MKRILILCLIVGCIGSGMSQSARASIQAFSNLEIRDFGILIDDPTTVAVGDFVPLSLLTPGFGLLSPPIITATTSATLTPYGTAGPFSVPGFDAPQAIVPGATPIAENTFTPTAPGTEPFSRSDTTGAGAIIAGLGPFGAGVNTVAEVQLSPPVTPFGQSGGTVSTSAEFRFTLLADASLSARLEAMMLLIAALDVPPGINVNASSAFSIRVENMLTGDFLAWAPDGSATVFSGGITATEVDDPFSINTAISRGIGAGTGTTTNSKPFDDFQLDFLLPAGSYALTINHASNATARSNLIPEPTSVIVWSIIGLVVSACGYTRRNRIG